MKKAQLRRALEILPSEPVPEGQYLVHNDITPTKPLGLGLHGFRAWIQTKADNLVPCHWCAPPVACPVVVAVTRRRDAVRYRSPVRAGDDKKPSPGVGAENGDGPHCSTVSRRTGPMVLPIG